MSSSVTPKKLTFAAQTAGTASVGQAVTLTNTGGLSLPISKITLSGANPGQFVQSNNCGGSLAIGASCTINAVFKPTTRGGKSATLAVTDATGTKSVALSGKGK